MMLVNISHNSNYSNHNSSRNYSNQNSNYSNQNTIRILELFTVTRIIVVMIAITKPKKILFMGKLSASNLGRPPWALRGGQSWVAVQEFC